MELKVLGPVAKITTPTSRWVAEIKFMEGDADGWSTETYVLLDDAIEAHKIAFLTMLNFVHEAIKNDRRGRGGYQSFNHLINECYTEIPGYREHLMDYEEDECDDIEERSIYAIEIPTDRDGFYTSFYGLNLFYYDKNGIKYYAAYE